MANEAGTLEAALRQAGFRGLLIADCPLAPLTTWRIGGPAELLARPADADDASCAVEWAEAAGVAWHILGNGSNLLVRDEGVRGLVVHVRRGLDAAHLSGERMTLGAGLPLPVAVRRAAAAGLAGLEFGAGIPGTVGGAIVMNAGWHEAEIGARVEWVDCLEPGHGVRRLGREECAFGYRQSRFRGKRAVVLGVGLALEPDDPRRIEERLTRYAASRRAHQPTDVPSCGSVFLKPPGDFAGRLIEAAGLKGRRVGDIEVSTLHANFFVNVGRGSAADALALIEQVERVVLERCGVRLEREVALW